jgi:hypothetical protein
MMASASGSADQSEGDDGFAAGAGSLFQFFEQHGFKVVGIGLHFAGSNLGFGSTVEAEIADAQVTFFRHERRTEGAAHHGAKFVEFTGPGGGVEHGTRLVVGKVIPAFAIVVVIGFIEQAGGGIARVFGGKAGDGIESAFADAGGAVGVGLFGICKTVLEAKRVELIDGEHPVATVRATGTAGQPFAAALHGVGEGGVDDLDELLISWRWGGTSHRYEDNLRVLFGFFRPVS